MSFGVQAALGAAVFALSVAVPAGAAPGDIESVQLTLLGKSSLPSPGLDGQTKPRGQNSDVAVYGDTAFVAGGSVNHGAHATPGRICTDYGGVKVVDISDPANPRMTTTIDIVATKEIQTAPFGNPRRGLTGTAARNVATSVGALDIIRHPVAGKTILAITTQRCEQSFFNGARLEFWDVTNPAAPSRIGVFDPETVVNPLCNPGPPISCPQGVSPPDGRWGIFEDVRMFTRNNGPGGAAQVYALATTPFSIGNTGGVSFAGDLRLLNITDPSAPQQLATFPSQSIGQNSNNGCRVFMAGRGVALSPDRSRAFMTYFDGAQPSTGAASLIRTALGGPNSAAVFNLDLDNLPRPVAGSDPLAFNPNPPVWGYPPAPDDGNDPAAEVEGNAHDVEPFLGPNGELMTVVSEEDPDASITRVTIDGPPEADYTGRGCQVLIGDKLYLKPGQQVGGAFAFVGRGCPASPIAASTNLAADPYLEDPNGKIAVIDGGGSGFDGCSNLAKLRRAVAAGATATVFNLGADLLGAMAPGGDGGIPSVPMVAAQLGGFDRLAGYLPNRVQTSLSFSGNWTRTSTTNVFLRLLAIPIASPAGVPANGATNASPIVVNAPNHGLATGDRVAIRGVLGNTAANGTWTVTVTSASAFSLDGSTGNGARTGGGYVYACPAAEPDCAAPDTRTDVSRFSSVANATDRVGGAALNAVVVTTTAAAAAGATTLPVQSLAGPIAVGATIRFLNGATATVAGSAAAPSGATSLTVVRLPKAIPSGAVGSVAAPVTGGQSYRAGGNIEVQARSDGAFKASIVWYDAAGAEVGESEITPAGGLQAVSPRTAYAQDVTAPANAARAGARFGWTGATADGTAFVDALFLRPGSAATVTLRDDKGEWGAQRIVDWSQTPPKEIATVRSPTSKVWPPPDNGIYHAEATRMLGNELAFSAWLSDGLRVFDVSDPAQPKEVAALVPPDVADPSSEAGAGPTDRAGQTGSLMRGDSWPDQTLIQSLAVVPSGNDEALVALSDINAGLYLVRAKVTREPAPVATPTPTATPVPTAVPTATPTVTPPRCAKLRLLRSDSNRARLRVVPTVRTGCAGSLRATASAKVKGKKRALKLKAAVRRVSSRTFAITVNLKGKAVRAALRRGKVPVTVRLTFRPSARGLAAQRGTVRVVVR